MTTIRDFFETAVSTCPDHPHQKFLQQDEWVTRNYPTLNDRVIRATAIFAGTKLR